MCLLRVERAKRSSLSDDVVLINLAEFERLRDPLYFKVLADRDRPEGISKSYYYYILSRLRDMGLVFDNSYYFSVAIPYYQDVETIRLGGGFLALTTSKYLIHYDEEYPGECKCDKECSEALNDLADELKLEPKGASVESMLKSLVIKLVTRISERARHMRLPRSVIWTKGT